MYLRHFTFTRFPFDSSIITDELCLARTPAARPKHVSNT